jgi:DHA1 family bicyclomycin/chloramphenicol resistance-like MFS transporter
MKPRLLQLTLVLGALAAFAPMSVDMYLPSLPTLARVFGSTGGAVQHTLAAFFVGLALGQLVYGPLADRFGRKPPLYAGTLLFVAASAACALAPSLDSLVALRFLQALGCCAGIVIVRAVVRDLFQAHEAARMFSLIVLVMGAAPILAPLAGGWLLVLLGWPAIFWALALFGLLCLAGAAAWLPETRAAHAVQPLSGALRAYAQLLGDRRFVGFALAGGLAQAGMFAYISASPQVFIDVYGVPAQHYGWLFGLNAFGLIAASQLNRRLLARSGPRAILDRAAACNAALGAVLLVLGGSNALGLAGILLPLFGYIASLGAIFPNSQALALAEHGTRAGIASALIGTLQYTVAAGASALVGALYDGTALPMCAVIAGCGLLAFAAGRWLVPR